MDTVVHDNNNSTESGGCLLYSIFLFLFSFFKVIRDFIGNCLDKMERGEKLEDEEE